jgi:hypothetical protein
MPPAWFVEWAESVNLWGTLLIAGGITAFILGVVAFFKKGWPWLVSFARAIQKTSQVVDAVQELPEFIARTDQRIAEIHHEVHYNNGSSVKDAVRRVENGVAGLYDEIAELKEADDAIRRDIDGKPQ